jgi:2-methylcitrate dehydratase PrpD
MVTYSRRFAEFTAGLAFKDIPGEVVEKCKMHLLDSLGICFAASTTDYAGMLYEFVREERSGGRCTLVGFPESSSASWAAFLNASLIHGLDFDDTHSGAIVHASTNVVPPALALGELEGIKGAALVEALVAGYEVAARIGLAAPGEFHKKGFHATPICGIFGAAAAAGKVLGLTPEQVCDAFGLCGSQSAGIQEFLNDGAWNKKIHPGWAAHGAVLSVGLARRGFKGSEKIFEGGFGLYNTHVGMENVQPARITAGLNSVWETRNISLKPYPCCHYLHAFVDAALHLKARHEILPQDVSEVECLISAPQIHIVCEPLEVKRAPLTPYGALFSLPFSVAMALVQGRVGAKDFFEIDIHDREVLDLAGRVHYSIDDESDFPRHFPGVVKVRLKNGQTFEHRERFNRGCPENPLGWEEVTRKFLDNAAGVLDQKRSGALIDKVRDLENLENISEIMTFCEG